MFWGSEFKYWKKSFKKNFFESKKLYLCPELIINLLIKSKMKRVVLSLAAVALMTVVSCKDANAEAVEETVTEEVVAPVEETVEAVEETTEEAVETVEDAVEEVAK